MFKLNQYFKIKIYIRLGLTIILQEIMSQKLRNLLFTMIVLFLAPIIVWFVLSLAFGCGIGENSNSACKMGAPLLSLFVGMISWPLVIINFLIFLRVAFKENQSKHFKDKLK